VVGAYALALHGAPRFTGDLDILVRPSLENAARLLEALEAFGFPVPDLSPEAIADRRRMLQMGVPPVQIPVVSAISGVEWEEVWSDRVEGILGRNRVSFLGRATFLRNKRAAGMTRVSICSWGGRASTNPKFQIPNPKESRERERR
jgi:hypothetical protein